MSGIPEKIYWSKVPKNKRQPPKQAEGAPKMDDQPVGAAEVAVVDGPEQIEAAEL